MEERGREMRREGKRREDRGRRKYTREEEEDGDE